MLPTRPQQSSVTGPSESSAAWRSDRAADANRKPRSRASRGFWEAPGGLADEVAADAHLLTGEGADRRRPHASESVFAAAVRQIVLGAGLATFAVHVRRAAGGAERAGALSAGRAGQEAD